MPTEIEKKQPIPRHEAIKPLSRDHHFGLLLCWKIREGFRRNIEPNRMKKYTDWFWENNLQIHFQDEENWLFPLLGNNHELIRKALSDHRRLKRLFEENVKVADSLSLIEEELERHIRFEERELFNEIQKIASPEQLLALEGKITEGVNGDDWPDPFWK